MKNATHEGRIVTVTAPATVTSGQAFLVGAMLVVAMKDAASGASVAAARVGGFTLPATTADAWVQGDKLYWDDTNKKLTDTASGNTLVGVADGPKVATTQTTANVILTGQV